MRLTFLLGSNIRLLWGKLLMIREIFSLRVFEEESAGEESGDEGRF